MINGNETIALLDTGAARSYISTQAVKKADIESRNKENPYQLANASGETMKGWVEKETVQTQIAIQQHRETISFDVYDMASYNIILGLPWLKKHNPIID